MTSFLKSSSLSFTETLSLNEFDYSLLGLLLLQSTVLFSHFKADKALGDLFGRVMAPPTTIRTNPEIMDFSWPDQDSGSCLLR